MSNDELYPGMELAEPINDVLDRLILNEEAQLAQFGNINYARWDPAHPERIRDRQAAISHKSIDLIAKRYGFNKKILQDVRYTFVYGMAMQRKRNFNPEVEPNGKGSPRRRREGFKLTPPPR